MGRAQLSLVKSSFIDCPGYLEILSRTIQGVFLLIIHAGIPAHGGYVVERPATALRANVYRSLYPVFCWFRKSRVLLWWFEAAFTVSFPCVDLVEV